MNSLQKIMRLVSDFMRSVNFPDMKWTVIHFWGMFQRAKHRRIH